MNIFRLFGDLIHLTAFCLLICRILKNKTCSGISGKTQILYAIAYTARYLDIIIYFYSLYNSLMKIIFLALIYLTVYLIYNVFRDINEEESTPADPMHWNYTFIEYLVIPSFVLALMVNNYLSPLEVLWTFSIYLEAVAIIPQLFMILNKQKTESVIRYYVIALMSYKILYILNWIYRYFAENYYNLIADVAGIVETLVYGYFLVCSYTMEIPKTLEYPT